VTECSEWNRCAWGGDVKDHTSCCLIGIIIYTCDLGGGEVRLWVPRQSKSSKSPSYELSSLSTDDFSVQSRSRGGWIDVLYIDIIGLIHVMNMD